MPKYYCDYCDTHLTHDSPSVRKTHTTGKKHKDYVKFYYESWMGEQAQQLIDVTTAAFKAGKFTNNPFGQPRTIGVPPPVQSTMVPRPGAPPMMPPIHGPGGPMPPMMMPPPHRPAPPMMGMQPPVMDMMPMGPMYRDPPPL